MHLLGTESIAKIFDVEMDTIRKWIKSRTFGDYQQDGRLLFVAKSAVKRYHDSIIKTNKR